MRQITILVIILLCVTLTPGCLNRSSDSSSSSSSGVSTISGNFSSNGLASSAPAHAPQLGNSIVGTKITAVSSSGTVSATFNPSANTFLLSNIVEGVDYTVSFYSGAVTYKAKIKVPSGKQIILTDIKSVSGSTGKIEAVVASADKSNPGTGLKVCGCRFDSTGNVSETDANSSGTWSSQTSTDLYTTISSKFVDLTSTYSNYSSVLTNLTLALSEGYDNTSSSLTDLNSVSRATGTAPTFSVIYAKTSSATSNESLTQGDPVYVTVTLSNTPASTDAFELSALIEVLNSSGSITSSKYHSRSVTFSSNKYTISTADIAADASGKSTWTTFKEQGQIRATITIYNTTTKLWSTSSETISVASRTPALVTPTVSLSGSTATVTWTKPTKDYLGVDLTSNTSAGITGYKIYRCASDGSNASQVNPTAVGADTLTYSDTSYSSSTPYYKVIAYYTYSSYDYEAKFASATAVVAQ